VTINFSQGLCYMQLIMYTFKIMMGTVHSLLYNGYRVFPGGKAAGAWCWPLTPF
jgi:hypothetical protein